MKSSNLWRIIWIVGIYAILATILYLVVIYKVKWEHKDLNTYLYIYNCNQNLCSSTTKPEDYYNKVLCENDICPYIIDIIDNNNVILRNETKSWVYNYIKNEIVNNQYINYQYIKNDTYIVTNEENKQGVITSDGEILIETKYNYIDNYLNGFVSYKENGLYGIDTPEDKNNIEPSYNKVILINDKIFSGMKNNKYSIYKYSDANNQHSEEYNFLYAYNDIILIANNKKIDILTTDLKSTLVMKINTFYEYTAEKERDSLKINTDGEYIYFNVFTSETQYTTYKYNISSKKLI